MIDTMTAADHNLGLNLVRLAPLVISTASVMCQIDQTAAIRPFAQPTLAKSGGAVLPYWFPIFFARTIRVVALSYPLAFGTALLNTWKYGVTLEDTTKYFYWVGMAFSAGHFLYAPRAMKIIGRINDTENPGPKNIQAVHEWLSMNFIRLLTVDMPGFIMYLCAVLSAARFV